MSRKSLILCLAALAVMILGTGVAVAFLYSDSDSGKVRSQVADENRYLLFSVVPSDAVAVARFSSVEDVLPGFMGRLSCQSSYGQFPYLVSFHDSGKLIPLFVFDAGSASDVPSEAASALVAEAESKGYFAEFVNCADYESASRLARHSIVVVSDSETLVRSAVRHLDGAASLAESHKFAAAAGMVAGENLLFLSNSYASKLFPSVLAGKYSSYSDFISRFADWTVFRIDDMEQNLILSGHAVYDDSPTDFINVIKKSAPSCSSISQILPSYVRFAASLPLDDMQSYIKAYELYLDSRQALHRSKDRQRSLSGKMGISPMDFMNAIELEEIAVASFESGSSLEQVLLMKTGTDELGLLFKGTDVKSLKDYSPQIHSWPYVSFASSVFGKFFSLKDESCFTFINGWIVVGSMKAVEEYVSGRALDYTLEEYFADASQDDLLAARSSFVSYFSFSEAHSSLAGIFRPSFLELLSPVYKDAGFAPAVLSVGPGKKDVEISFKLLDLTLKKTKAPAFERDTVVYVPKGPFEVKNSGTGKMNRFYQNSHLSLCLSEDGKDLWGVPFKLPVCGTAHTVDYYQNGKLQIIFGAGSKIYLIDRLGRYVNGFPIDLGKEILLGPDVYDFNGARRYNIMVLHKDNSIEMYNLNAVKPAAWKGITAEETIKALPERIVVGGNTFWVVRTSIQTLIFPFYGGEPITRLTGNEMILPESEIHPVDEASVEVLCYNGKKKIIRLK